MSGRANLVPSCLLTGGLLGTPEATSGDAPVRRRRGRYSLGNPGRPSAVPTLLIAVFDNSGSVVCPVGADPMSNRYAEVERAFAAVARRGSQHELGAVLHFDTPTSGDVGPVPITRRGFAELRRGLVAPPDGAGTSELGPSLRRSVELAESYPDHQVTLVVLSDFLLLDEEPLQVLADLTVFPGQVHTVALGDHAAADLLDIRVAVTRVKQDDEPGAVARALFTSLVADRPGSRVDSG